MDSQIPYFCGSSSECLTLGSREALELAKYNIENKFVTVGLLENLDVTHQVLECLMPDQMQGLAREHASLDLHQHSDHKHPEFIRLLIQIQLQLYFQL